MRFIETKRLRDYIQKMILVYLLLMVFAPARTTIAASSVCTVNVLPYANSGQNGEIFTVNITIMGVQNLYGVEVKLYWNSEILSIVDVEVSLGETDGVLYKPIFIAENLTKEGQYLLAATSTSGTPFSGSGNVVRISFMILKLADSKIDLQTQLYDYPPPDREPQISMPIEHATIDGYFDVTSPEIGIPTRIPNGEIYPGQTVKIEVNVTDSTSGVQNVTLSYTTNNESSWETLAMLQNSTTGVFEATIPPQNEKTEVRYEIIACDFANNIQVWDGSDPCCTYIVVHEVLSYAVIAVFMILTILTLVFSIRILTRNSKR